MGISIDDGTVFSICCRRSDALTAAGATLITAPTRTPWNSRNARLAAPAGLQLTLFEELA